ncbi:MAG: sulfoxide reductase heme-binding subunit YedZ [Bryobacterales bacterium]|nr:sulfoxide reductase heme-binding subunit YedZ [Bryobacterales bacterium]MEB2363366.1 sulfoxide reductase heme-binding subunit YedZ [Bryobacterales bacterium]
MIAHPLGNTGARARSDGAKAMALAKTVVWILALVPAAVLIWKGFRQELGPNPIEYITHATGDWTLRLLLITLAISPLRKILRFPQLIRFRRLLGLFAFFYGFLHFLTYILLDQFLDFPAMLQDIGKRPFITAGFTSFLLLLPLAATSTAGWIRRLGGKRWQQLHRAIYLSAALGVLHYYWLVKSDIRMPVFYGAILAALLSARLLLRRAPAK